MVKISTTAMPTYMPARAERTRWPRQRPALMFQLDRRLFADRLNAVAVHGESLRGGNMDRLGVH